jgi:DNA-binding response OmpR family regulator
VRAARLEAGALTAALERGDFYASTGVVLDEVTPTEKSLSVKVRAEGDSKYRIQFIGRGGQVLSEVTARAEESDRIIGLEIGADDYISKPFSPNELVARVRALMRRSKRSGAAGPTIAFGPLVMDLDRHTVLDEGREVKLTAKEFMLLQYLMQHRGRVLSRDLLLGDVWGYRYTGGAVPRCRARHRSRSRCD